MNVERLTFLSAKLKEDAANPEGIKFDLRDWYGRDGDLKVLIDKKNPISCGTTACAFGFAALLPEFQEQGLKVTIGDGTYGSPIGTIYPQFGEDKGIDAAISFFDITGKEANRLFDPTYYTGKPTVESAGELAVAKRIDSLIADRDGFMDRVNFHEI